MSMNKVVLVGAFGTFAEKRLRAIQRSGDVLSAVCDINPEMLYQFQGRDGLVTTQNYRDLLDTEGNIVVISVPDETKQEIIEAFLKAGKHVVVEKPLSLHTETVRRLFSMARENHVALYVGYNLRFFPSIREVIRLRDEGYFGEVFSIRCFYGHGGGPRLVQQNNWRTRKESWGGSFVDMGTHLLNLCYLFVRGMDRGEVIKQHVFSTGQEDSCHATLQSGACVLELASSWVTWRSRFSASIHGKEGFAEMEGLAKYVKYGQDGERLHFGKRAVAGPPEVTEKLWRPSSHPGAGGCTPVDEQSVALEFLDEEWRWFVDGLRNGTYDMEDNERLNVFIAEFFERYYS